MYEKEDDIVKIIEDAKGIISKSRQKYDKLMRRIEEFIIDNDIIVNKNDEKYFFDLYLYDMNLSKNLTILLYNLEPLIAKYITLITKIYNRHQRIIIDGITFVHISYINNEIKNNILFYECNCKFIKGRYKCFGPEIQLIDLYTNLYMPIDTSKWPELLIKEKELIKNLRESIKNRLITGGNEDSNADDADDADDSSDKSDGDKSDGDCSDSIVKQLLLRFVKNRHIIIGKIAVDLYNNKKIIQFNKLRLQLITEVSLDEEIDILKKKFPDLRHVISHLHLPINLNIYKIILYHGKTPVMDIFNVATFQICPFNINIFNNKKLQLASPYVIKCFKLIDVWNILYMSKVGLISSNVANNIIDHTMSDELPQMPIKNQFPLNFIGKYEDLNIKRERLANKLKTKFIIPFMPYQKSI